MKRERDIRAFFWRLVKSQKRRWPNNNCGLLDTVSREKQRPETKQNFVDGREIRWPADDQELLLCEEVIGDHCSCPTRSEELGKGGEKMCQEDKQVLDD